MLTLIAVSLTACASQPTIVNMQSVPGFWMGLVHGFISPFSFIGSLFLDNVRIYSFPNNGVWYDFGFVLGSGILFGGGSKAS